MTHPKDQAIARFIEAVKLDRHDVEDWPKDSREAFEALQKYTCEFPQMCPEHCHDYEALKPATIKVGGQK